MLPAWTSPWNVPQRDRRQEEGPHHLLHQRRRVVPDLRTVARSSIGHAVEELHREHVAARELEVGRSGTDHAVEVELDLAAAGSAPASAPRCAGPAPRRSGRGSRRTCAAAAGHLVAGLPDEDLEQRLHQVEVGRDEVLDVGPQHLDRHPGAVERWSPCARPRSRPSRSGSPRSSAKASRSVSPRSSSTRLTLVERHRRAGVEARPELVGHLLAEHPGRRGDDLAELHERAAQVLERAAKRDGRRHRTAGCDGAPSAAPGVRSGGRRPSRSGGPAAARRAWR